ncbi:hypothetical protein FJY71_00665, partial [candidate division WOR-3 bacterium]|nr:hypothetical protein [candidate division WOR-3 bacterium]
VTDSLSGAPIRARVKPMPINFPSCCDSLGDYHRYLRPGTYSVVFEANGYRPKTVTGVVVAADTVTYLDVRLAPDTSLPVSLHKFVWGRGVSDEAIASTPDWALGAHDGRRYSLGRGGIAAYDFGRQVFNMAGNDLTVYEDDADPEGYRVDVANDLLGPWTAIGWDTGTASFDLAHGGVSTCRYIKVTDDSGATSGATAGFDLDAIEAVVANAAALVYYNQVVQDSPPGGNNDGRLDPGETAGLVLGLRNIGRHPVADLQGRLSTTDTFVAVLDSTGAFGLVQPDSVRWSLTDKYRVSARPNTPREHQATMKLALSGTDYSDSLTFTLTVGELRMCDPIPDGPRQPALYWCYDNTDTGYAPCPVYNWVEIRGQGTRLTLSDDQTVQLSLPSGFGPWRFYGQSFSQISVCSNGWVAPGTSTSTTYTPLTLPDPNAPSAVFLNWIDLYPPAGGGVWYYHDAANHRFIVEYDSVRYYSGGMHDKFELVIYDTTVRTPSGDNVFWGQFYSNNGGYGGIGEQDPTKTIAINYTGPAAAPIQPGRAVKYTTEYAVGMADGGRRVADGRSRLAVCPNVFCRSTRVNWLAPQNGTVELQVYDASGRAVTTLASGAVRAGRHSTVWDGTDDSGRRVAEGIYFVRLESAGGRLSVKAVRLE